MVDNRSVSLQIDSTALLCVAHGHLYPLRVVNQFTQPHGEHVPELHGCISYRDARILDCITVARIRRQKTRAYWRLLAVRWLPDSNHLPPLWRAFHDYHIYEYIYT